MTFFCRFDPTSQHAPDFIDDFLQWKNFLQLQCLRIFCESKEQTKDIQFHADLLQRRKFVGSWKLAGQQNALKYIKNQVFRSLPECVSIRFGHNGAQRVERFVEIVCLTENRDIKLLHYV